LTNQHRIFDATRPLAIADQGCFYIPGCYTDAGAGVRAVPDTGAAVAPVSAGPDPRRLPDRGQFSRHPRRPPRLGRLLRRQRVLSVRGGSAGPREVLHSRLVRPRTRPAARRQARRGAVDRVGPSGCMAPNRAPHTMAWRQRLGRSSRSSPTDLQCTTCTSSVPPTGSRTRR
jgi:hypothetical protein